MITEYNFYCCDCCEIELGYSEFTIFEEYDTQLLICEDCHNIEE